MPEKLQNLLNEANRLLQNGDLIRAQQLAETVLQQNCDMPETYVLLTRIAISNKQFEQGKEYIARALTLNAGVAEHHFLLGHIERNLGNNQQAGQHLLKALDLNPTHIGAFYLLSQSRAIANDHPSIKLFANAAKNPDNPSKQRIMLAYALGQVFDQAGQYDEAFSFFQIANDLADTHFDLSGDIALTQRCIAFFSSERIREFIPLGNPSERPVFIIGMPRSGTTLAEQILAAHPQVFGADELDDIPQLVRQLSEAVQQAYPDSLVHLDQEAISALAEVYLAHLFELDENALRITDKMPINFLYLGFINILFPNARIIHCQRDPLDTILSCYFQDFTKRIGFANNLETLARVYRMYRDLMKHWQRTLTLDIHELNYQDVVENSEKTIRDLVAFLDLPWDDQCLRFYTTQRVPETASIWQAQQPIYKGSLQRWRNYEKYLTTVKEILGE